MQVACTRAGGYETRNSAAADGARDGHDVVVSSCGPIHLPPCTMTFVDSRRVRSAGCDTQIGAYTHRTPRLRICAKMRRWGACRSLTRALGAWSIAGDNNAWDLATQSCVVTYIAHWRRCATALSDTVQAAWACWACGQLVIRAGRRMADGEGRLVDVRVRRRHLSGPRVLHTRHSTQTSGYVRVEAGERAYTRRGLVRLGAYNAWCGASGVYDTT